MSAAAGVGTGVDLVAGAGRDGCLSSRGRFTAVLVGGAVGCAVGCDIGCAGVVDIGVTAAEVVDVVVDECGPVGIEVIKDALVLEESAGKGLVVAVDTCIVT